jgi:hypothetical protein
MSRITQEKFEEQTQELIQNHKIFHFDQKLMPELEKLENNQPFEDLVETIQALVYEAVIAANPENEKDLKEPETEICSIYDSILIRLNNFANVNRKGTINICYKRGHSFANINGRDINGQEGKLYGDEWSFLKTPDFWICSVNKIDDNRFMRIPICIGDAKVNMNKASDLRQIVNYMRIACDHYDLSSVFGFLGDRKCMRFMRYDPMTEKMPYVPEENPNSEETKLLYKILASMFSRGSKKYAKKGFLDD